MVLNRFEQRDREDAEQRRKAELQRQKDELARQQAELQRQIESRRSAEARHQFVRTNSDYVFKASGVLKELRDLERGKLTNTVNKHELVIDLDTGTAELAWGNKFTVENNKISNVHRFLSSLTEADYQSIEVKVDPDTLGLTISGASRYDVSQSDWQNNPNKLLDALIDAYKKPHRIIYREEPYSPSDSSSGYSGGQAEC